MYAFKTLRNWCFLLFQMSFVCILLFWVAWSPYAIICLWSAFGDPAQIPLWAATAPALFAKSSTFYNPIVYVATNRQFRRSFLSLSACQRETNDSRLISMKQIRQETATFCWENSLCILWQMKLIKGKSFLVTCLSTRSDLLNSWQQIGLLLTNVMLGIINKKIQKEHHHDNSEDGNGLLQPIIRCIYSLRIISLHKRITHNKRQKSYQSMVNLLGFQRWNTSTSVFPQLFFVTSLEGTDILTSTKNPQLHVFSCGSQ